MKPVFQTSSFVFLLAFVFLTLPARAQKESENTAPIAKAKPKIQLGFTIENRFQIGTSFYAPSPRGANTPDFRYNFGAAFRYNALFGLSVGGYFIPRIGIGLNLFHESWDVSKWRYQGYDPSLETLKRLDYLSTFIEFPLGFTVVPLPNKPLSPYVSFDITQRVILASTSFSTYESAQMKIKEQQFSESKYRYCGGFDFSLGVRLNHTKLTSTKIGLFTNVINFFFADYEPGMEKNRFAYALQFGLEASIVLSRSK